MHALAHLALVVDSARMASQRHLCWLDRRQLVAHLVASTQLVAQPVHLVQQVQAVAC
jgi:hypothetical protein